MRAALLFLVLTFAASCGDIGRVQPKDARWEYQAARGAVATQLSYKFEDGEGTRLIGRCPGEPVFSLYGGGYETTLPPKFLLTVDDRSWTLPAWEGHHGRGLLVQRYEPNLAIGRAKHRIVFQVGDWRREVRPGPTLTDFMNGCG